MLRKLHILMYVISLATNLLASDPPKISFDHITTNDGFYGKSITRLFQDSKDFLWIGTREGLYRYNGYTFELFQHNVRDSACISSNIVGSIAEDHNGNIWIGTTKGINLYNRACNNFINEFINHDSTVTIQEENIWALFVDKSDNIWVGTNNGNIYLIKRNTNGNARIDCKKSDSDSWEIIKIKNTLSDQYAGGIRNISEGDDGMIYAGTPTGLILIEPEEMVVREFINFENLINSGKRVGISRVFKRNNGDFWLGSLEGGLFKFNLKTKEVTTYFLTEKSRAHESVDFITCIYEDNDGDLWVGTRNKGLYLFNEKEDRFYNYSSDPSDPKTLGNNTVVTVLKDRFGLLWVGTWNGLNKGIIKNGQFINIRAQPGSPAKAEVKGFFLDDNEKVWVATDNGLNILRKDFTLFKRFEFEPYDDSRISHFVVNDIERGHDGRFYVATFGGIDVFDQQYNLTGHIRHREGDSTSLSNNYIFDMLINGDSLWVATLRGVNLYDLGTGRVNALFSRQPGTAENRLISSDISFVIAKDNDGNIWTGGSRGLNRIIAGSDSIVRFLHDPLDISSLSDNHIRDIFVDSNGDVWIGTANGINKWIPEQSKFERFFTDDMPNIEVVSINEDVKGRLWLGTMINMIMFDPANEEKTFFHTHDGIDDCNFILHSNYRDAGGRLFFGNSNGMIVFNPDSITLDILLPKVYLTDFEILNKKVMPGESIDGKVRLEKSIELSDTIHIYHGDQVISFEWVALYFNDPLQLKYRYILENFEHEWNDVNAWRRFVSYSNLPGGTYIFKVKASNHKEIWGDETARVVLIVHPPYWDTFWFKLLLAVSLVLVGVFYYRYRSYNIRKQNKRLEAQVMRRTELIEEQKSEMERQYLEIRERTEEISKQYEELQSQNEVIFNQNELLLEKNTKIERQKEELLIKAEKLGRVQRELSQANSRLKDLNTELENLVNERTRELRMTIERLEKTDHELSTFLYHASHDLRGPLTTMLGLTYLSEIENVDPALQVYFLNIRNTANRLMRTLRKLSEANMFFDGNFEFSEVNMQAICDDIAPELNRIDADSLVSRQMNIHLNGTIYSNDQLLRIILLYVMENAIVFRKEGRDSYLKLNISEKDKKLNIRCEDNGDGIPSEILDRVFSMFYRGSEKSQGNGLGLYLVKKAVSALGGTCTIDSKLDQFCIFTAEIPLRPHS